MLRGLLDEIRERNKAAVSRRWCRMRGARETRPGPAAESAKADFVLL